MHFIILHHFPHSIKSINSHSNGSCSPGPPSKASQLSIKKFDFFLKRAVIWIKRDRGCKVDGKLRLAMKVEGEMERERQRHATNYIDRVTVI